MNFRYFPLAVALIAAPVVTFATGYAAVGGSIPLIGYLYAFLAAIVSSDVPHAQIPQFAAFLTYVAWSLLSWAAAAVLWRVSRIETNAGRVLAPLGPVVAMVLGASMQASGSPGLSVAAWFCMWGLLLLWALLSLLTALRLIAVPFGTALATRPGALGSDTSHHVPVTPLIPVPAKSTALVVRKDSAPSSVRRPGSRFW